MASTSVESDLVESLLRLYPGEPEAIADPNISIADWCQKSPSCAPDPVIAVSRDEDVSPSSVTRCRPPPCGRRVLDMRPD